MTEGVSVDDKGQIKRSSGAGKVHCSQPSAALQAVRVLYDVGVRSSGCVHVHGKETLVSEPLANPPLGLHGLSESKLLLSG